MANLESLYNKIVPSPYTLSSILSDRHPNSRIVLVKGAYDIMHEGHVQSYFAAKELGDILVVGVNSDSAISARKGPERPIRTQMARMRLIASTIPVDWVTMYDEIDPINLINILKPDIFAASHFEWNKSGITRNIGSTQLLTLPKTGELSTTETINKIIRVYGLKEEKRERIEVTV